MESKARKFCFVVWQNRCHIGAIMLSAADEVIDAMVAQQVAKLDSGRKYIRGLFSGGTLSYE